MVELATRYGRYGFRRVTALLRAEGFRASDERAERPWRREGLGVPAKQPKRGRLWDNKGSCARLRPERKDHVWAYDLVQDRTRDGRAFRMLTVVDEFTRERLAIGVGRKVTSEDVLERPSGLFVRRGTPGHMRSDNGPEFTAKAVRERLGQVGVTALPIEPGLPWENGYVESFNGKLRDELLERGIFDTLLEARVLIERWRVEYDWSGRTARRATARRRPRRTPRCLRPEGPGRPYHRDRYRWWGRVTADSRTCRLPFSIV
jgi:transposase InsO family protein